MVIFKEEIKVMSKKYFRFSTLIMISFQNLVFLSLELFNKDKSVLYKLHFTYTELTFTYIPKISTAPLNDLLHYCYYYR